jgi:fucose 4-O-acetylase-like acetyltransferase
MTITHIAQTNTQPERSRGKSVRLHYLDWLRVLATLGVFLFHAVHPFDFFDWEIKNAEQSMVVTVLLGVGFSFGMPLFFLIAGTGSWFSLRRRTGRQYAGERFKRLLIPFIIGAILLSPIQLYFTWSHQTQTALFEGSFLEFLESYEIRFSPMVFGAPLGFHLWFVGFLFAFSLIALPFFLWLKGESGRRFIAWLGGLCERRRGILLFILPLVLVQLILRPVYPDEHDWADFIYLLFFFIYGYILYADERFSRVILRDWQLLLILGTICTLIIVVASAIGVGPRPASRGSISPGACSP